MRTIDLFPLSLRAALDSVDPDRRTADLVWSTGAPVDRVDYAGQRYIEVLSMDPRHVRLDRLNSGAPLLDSHSVSSVTDILGTVLPGSARVDGNQGLAKVQFSRRPAIDAIWTDVIDGIVRAVSIGYRIYTLLDDGGTPVPTRTAVDWEPYEVSMVPMPADVGAGIRDGRCAPNPCIIVPRFSVEDQDRLRRLRLAQAIGRARGSELVG